MLFSPVIVIYNENCADSPSCTALINLGHKPIIVDNSTMENNNEQFCISNGLEYISMHGNKGIPKAYNCALDHIKARNKEGYVIWLDDDTELDSNYFTELEKAINSDKEAKIFVPVVYSLERDNYILSPCILNTNRVFNLKPIDTLDDIDSKEILSAINSGMAVDISVYDNYRYDENMFLDFVDHDFMNSMKGKGIKIHVLRNASLYQNYSGHERPPKAQAKVRNEIFRKDYRIYGKKAGIPKFVVEKRLMNNKLQFFFRYLFRR